MSHPLFRAMRDLVGDDIGGFAMWMDAQEDEMRDQEYEEWCKRSAADVVAEFRDWQKYVGPVAEK